MKVAHVKERLTSPVYTAVAQVPYWDMELFRRVLAGTRNIDELRVTVSNAVSQETYDE